LQTDVVSPMPDPIQPEVNMSSCEIRVVPPDSAIESIVP
jgi:hypothetical protein